MKRKDYTLYFILLFALILRIYFALATTVVPDYSDMARYNELAAAGGFPTSLPPMYPLFLRSVYTVFGAYNYTAVYVIQAILSVATIWLIYYVTVKIADRRAGLTAAAIAAIYPTFVAYNLSTMTESMSLLFVMLMLALLVTGMDGWRQSILTAVALCLGFYLRPTFLFFIPGVFPLTKKRLWFVGVIVLFLAPWFIYGAVAGGGSGRAARMFYKTYNETTDGITNYEMAETPVGEDGVSSGTYIREAVRFVRENGWETVNITYNKFALILSRGYDQYLFKPHLKNNPGLTYWFYHFHIPIFLLGLIMMIRFYSRDLNVLIFPAASYLLASIMLAFFKIRYRLPVEPMFLIAASILISKGIGQVTDRFRRPVVPAGSGKKKKRAQDKKRKGKKPAARPDTKVASPNVDVGSGFGEFFSGILAYVREHWKLLLGIFTAVLASRILFLVVMGAVPVMKDSMHLLQLAVDGGINPGDPPLYPLFMRFLFFVSGGPNHITIYIVQALTGTVTVLLIYAIALKLFGRTMAIGAAVVAAVYLKFLLNDLTIGPRSLSVFMWSLMFAIALSDLSGRYRSIVCGVIVGLGTMIQPHFLFLAPGLLLVIDNKKIFLAAIAATLLPLAVRNSIVAGTLVPVYPFAALEVGGGNFFGLRNNYAIVDKLYKNGAVIFSRGWDKQQHMNLNGVLYTALYGYVITMMTGLAGLVRYSRREQGKLLLPMLGYFLIMVLLSRFDFEKRTLMEPLFVIYTGVLVVGAGRYLLSLLKRGIVAEANPVSDPVPTDS